MVGGSTAVPLVHQAVATLFGEKKVRHDIDPMQGVALGAAILAARLTGVECPECQTENPEQAHECKKCGASLASARIVVGDGIIGEVTAKSLGINVVGQDGKTDSFSVIIPKGTQYPLTQPEEKVFYTISESRIRVPVYEGEASVTTGNEFQGNVEYVLPRKVEANTPVSIYFNYDKDRVLTVRIRVHGYSDLEHEETILNRGGQQPHAESDDNWQEQLEATTRAAKHFLEQCGDFLGSRGVAKKLDKDIEEAQRALNDSNQVKGQQLIDVLHMSIFGYGTATILFKVDRGVNS